MTNAYKFGDKCQPTDQWVGRVHEVQPEFFEATIFDDYETQSDFRIIRIPLSNMVETELPNLREGILFHCGLEIIDEKFKIVWIEFSEALTEEMYRKDARMIFDVIRRAEEREV